MAEFVQKDAEANGMSVDEFIQAKMTQYAESGETLTREGAVKELVADYCAAKLFADEKAIRQLSAEKPSVARRIWAWLRSVKTKLLGTKQEKLIAKAEALYRDALMGPYRSGEGAQYSLQTNPDGTRYVQIDTDQEIFKGVPRREWPKVARRYINEHFRGKTLPLGEYDAASVKSKASGEYAYPRKPYPVESAEFAAKMRASTELDSLMEAAEYMYSADDMKNHSEATAGWDYYTVKFILGGHVFEGIINIANGENSRQFYDITKIREVPDVSTESDTSLDTAISCIPKPLIQHHCTTKHRQCQYQYTHRGRE